jgi:photosystem II stability/assembly factor-like uncharacterized protein
MTTPKVFIYSLYARVVCRILFLFLPISAYAEWVVQDSPVHEASLRSVQAVNANVVWVAGSQGTCLRTIDSRRTWERRVVPGGETLDFRGLAAFDDRTAIIVSAGEAEFGKARIFLTADGGMSWRLVFQTQQKGVFFDGVAFWDRRHGIAFGDPINGKWFLLTTGDGGLSWQPVLPEGLPAMLPNEAAFAASNSSILVRDGAHAWIASGGAERARVFLSQNRGRTWAAVNTPMPAGSTAGIFGIRFWDSKHGIGVGGDHSRDHEASENVILTSDGGRTWVKSMPAEPSGLKEAVVTLPQGQLLAVGPSGTALSRDRGRTWQRVDSLALHAAMCVQGHCWGVGPKGTIARWR